jgi:hypothetical protein
MIHHRRGVWRVKLRDLLTLIKRIKYVYYAANGGHAVAQLVDALRYKSEGLGFDSRLCR